MLKQSASEVRRKFDRLRIQSPLPPRRSPPGLPILLHRYRPGQTQLLGRLRKRSLRGNSQKSYLGGTKAAAFVLAFRVYLGQAQPSQAYNLSMAPPQCNMSEVGSNVPSHAHFANMAQATYAQTRTAPLAMQEKVASGIYRTGGSAGGSHLVQGPSGQHQQYVGISQIHHPAQSTVPNSGGTAANYAYEFANSAHGQIYYSHAMPPTLPLQYQTRMLSEAGSQQQQIRTSQPLQGRVCKRRNFEGNDFV